MHVICKIESANNDHIFYKGEVYKPKLVFQNGVGITKTVKYSLYILLPNNSRAYIYTNKEETINPNDTKEILIFQQGLTITKQYPSGQYYIVVEMTDMSRPSNGILVDSFAFTIESRSVFTSGQNLFYLDGAVSRPFDHILGYGNYSSFSNTRGATPNENSLRQTLKILKQYGVNLIRNFMLDSPGTGDTGDVDIIYPWVFDNGKFDLTRYNENYFNRLLKFARVYEEEKVIFHLDIFDHYTMGNSNIWPTHPLYPDMNHQNSYGLIKKNTAFPEFFDIFSHNNQMWTVIINYVIRIVQIMSSFDYKIYLIMNEACDGTNESITEFHNKIAEIIMQYDPNAIISANLLNSNPVLDAMIHNNNKNIEINEVHHAGGFSCPVPNGSYQKQYNECLDSVFIPDNDGLWACRNVENSLWWLEKILESGDRKYICKGPLPNTEGWTSFGVPFLQGAKDLLSNK